MTQPWAARPADLDKPGHFVEGGELEAVLDQIVFLTQPVVAELRATSVQSLTNGTGTAVNFDAEDIDSHGGHSTSVNTSRYTAQIAGWYQCTGAVSFASNATGRRGVWWQKNGADVTGSETAFVAAGTGVITIPARVKLIQLAVGDYVQMLAFQDSGGALNTSVTFAVQQPSMHVRLAYLS